MAFMYRKKRNKNTIRSEVNLTPLIDVMTSLLAIFMITTPLLTTGIALDLPKGDGSTLSSDEKTLDLNLNAKGEIFIGSTLVDEEDVLPKIQALLKENPKMQMIISADRKTDYGAVIELMALLRTAGYTQVGLKTDSKTMEVPLKKGAKSKR